MSFNGLKDLYKQVILDHSKYPRNNGEVVDGYKLEMLNPSCGDKITVSMDIEDNIIKDIKFVGTGCSISLASASMLTEELKGLSVSEANLKIKDFLNMIMGNDFNEDWSTLLSVHINNNNRQSTALGNIVDTRNKIAHGDSVNISISEYIRHYKDAKELLEHTKTLFDSIRQI